MGAVTTAEKDLKKNINAAVVTHLSTLPLIAFISGLSTFLWARVRLLASMHNKTVKDSRKLHTNRV